MVGCSRCTYPSIHLFVSKSRSVVRGAVVCCVCMRVLCCVVCVCWCWSLVVVVWCGVVWCGVVWYGVYFFVFSLFFSQLYFSFALSLSFFSLLSSLLATKHYGKNRSTNTAANIEAFECDLAQGKCRAVGSLPPPLPSLLPSPPPLLKKEEETFYYRNISGEGIILRYSFKINPENSPPGEITVITVLY